MKSKPWYESITIWGGAVSLLGVVLGFFNLAFPAGGEQTAANAAAQIALAWSARDYGSMLTGIVTLAGVIISIVGRQQANQPIHFIAPKSE